MPSQRPIAPPVVVEAETFHRLMSSGRNKALHISARAVSGETVDCVTKVPGLMENPTLHPAPCLFEGLASLLASQLGVTTPRPYEVILSREFAESVDHPSVSAGLSRSLGSVFGSQFVPGTPMVRGELLDIGLRRAGSVLLAFDVFVHNLDRRAENPNAFTTRDDVIAFDHGEAFPFVFPMILAPDPRVDPLHKVVIDHPMAPLVRRKGPAGLDAFRDDLAALNDARLDEIAAAVPAAWKVGQATGKLEKIVEILRARRDAVESWLPQVEAWMEPSQ